MSNTRIELDIDDTMFEKGQLPPKWVKIGIAVQVISLCFTMLGSGNNFRDFFFEK